MKAQFWLAVATAEASSNKPQGCLASDLPCVKTLYHQETQMVDDMRETGTLAYPHPLIPPSGYIHFGKRLPYIQGPFKNLQVNLRFVVFQKSSVFLWSEWAGLKVYVIFLTPNCYIWRSQLQQTGVTTWCKSEETSWESASLHVSGFL